MRLKELVRPYYLRWLYFRLFPERYPQYYKDCWRFPELAFYKTDPISPGARIPLDTARGSDPNPAFYKTNPIGLLFLPMTDWHTRIQRTQHLARASAALGRQCFYLNPHLGREFPRPYLFTRSPRLVELEPGIAELHVHLPLEPVFHHRPLSPAETDRIVSAIRILYRFNSSRRLIQIVSFPVWSELAQRLREEFRFPIVYDCHDTLAGFRGIAPELLEEEHKLMAHSDLVIFSALKLRHDNLARQPELAAKSMLLRNAVDANWLARGVPEKNSEKVVIGYLGALDFWFDKVAVESAARQHPEWEFRLIGRVEDPAIERLRALPNIRLTGEVPHRELLQHLSEFRAGLIPFLRNELTLGTNPIKLYEYFSYGLPVVSARLPEIEEFGDAVHLADTPEQWGERLEQALAEDSPALRERRRDLVRRETWQLRASQLLSALDALG
jgi:glycosyltransferase involved in cell wall biosynthesis